MNKYWLLGQERWRELTRRERVLVLIVLIAMPVVPIYIWLIEPSIIKITQAPTKLQVVKDDIRIQRQSLKVLQIESALSPADRAKKENKRLEALLAQETQSIRESVKKLVSPEQMLTTLRSVLDDSQDITLIRANSLQVETIKLAAEDKANKTETEPYDDSNSPQYESTEEQPVLSAQQTQNEASESIKSAVIYIHPFEVELKGNYQSIYQYLQKIEQLDAVFFWDMLDYKVTNYPHAEIKIKVHTLSSESGWLGV